MQPQLPDYLIDAQQGATDAAGTVGQLGSMSGSIVDALNTSIQDAYNNNQDIIGGLDTATAQYFQAPSEARVKFQDIWNPFQRENLVSQYTTNQAIPMLSYSSLYGQRMGRAGDLLKAGTGAYETDMAAKQAAADAAQRAYENALTQYQLEEDRRRWEIEQKNKGAWETSMLQQLLDLLPNPEGQGTPGVTTFEEDPSEATPVTKPMFNLQPGTVPVGNVNTGNITQYAQPTGGIAPVSSSTPFGNFSSGLDLGPVNIQAPQQRPTFMDWLRGLF